jgi:hypothetical protein
VRRFATKFRAAFPDLNFWGTADLIAEGHYVVGQWEGGGNLGHQPEAPERGHEHGALGATDADLAYEPGGVKDS